MDLLFALIKGFWIIIPAYAANGFAPLPKGKRRIDFGRKFLGEGLLGKGKTWEGLFFGIFIGSLCGLVEVLTWQYLNPIALENGFFLQKLTVFSVTAVASGAILGDITASFLKRRIGMKRGQPAILLDQLDFVIGAFILASLFVKVPLASVILIVIITPVIHYVSCYIGYKLGLKKVPW